MSEGLIVPLNMVAFCVGTIDAHEATNEFAGATVVYNDQVTEEHPAFLGANVTRGFTSAPWQPLEQGVHLHWAIPDALTHAVHSDQQLTFPALPNRWLVTRFVLDGSQTPSTKSWVVESDVLNEQPPSGQRAITLPVKTTDPDDQNFRYAGAYAEFDANWSSPQSPFGSMTGAPLSAVSNGVLTFANYYPECRSVFGFCDLLTDVPVSGNNPVPLMYTVTGWYADPTLDPLNGGARNRAALQTDLGWTFSGGDANPAFSLYSGIAQGIGWNPGIRYVFQQPSQKPINAAASIGNTPAEALAAWFRAENHPDIPFFEQLLVAFQYGYLADFTQGKPDQLARLGEILHDDQFAGFDSGIIYTIVADVAADDPTAEQIDLPLQLAEDLNLLNVRQEQYDSALAHQDAFQWQTFADWYRIFLATPETQNIAFGVAARDLQNWSTLSTAVAALKGRRDEQLKIVQDQVSSELVLRIIPADRYRQPSEPCILLTAPELQYPVRYGGDGSFREDGFLLCRLVPQILTAIAVNGQSVAASRFNGVALVTPNHLPYSDACTALLEEACLLNTALIAAVTGVAAATLQPALEQLLAGKAQSVYQATGQPPSPLAVEWWNGNPWLPVALQWTVSYLPLQATVQNDQLSDYTPEFFNANYQVNPDAGGFITYDPQGTGSIQVDPATAAFDQQYSGASFLSPAPAAHFELQIEQYLETNTDATLQAILTELQQANFLVQPLSGFTNGLLMRGQSVQLGVEVPPSSRFAQLTQLLVPIVGDQNTVSPLFNSVFNPVRAGWFKMFSLQAIDAFGQKRTVQLPSSIVIAASMLTVVQGQPVPDVAYVPPRIAQPARLQFDWLSADTSGLEEMTSHPAASPICGWLLPNHLTGGFFLYSQEGRPLGSLFLNGPQTAVVWQGAPGDNVTINQPIGTALQSENPILRAVALQLFGSTPAFFNAFWRVVDSAQTTINPRNATTNSGISVLIGRPVALAQASLVLQTAGTAALNLSWACFHEGEYTATDSGSSQVQFPVILGDLDQISDGLIGYFKQTPGRTSYDLTTFFSEAAGAAATSGVVQPVQDTLTLTAAPGLDATEPPDLGPFTQKVLMLIDPTATVHATSGILPTAILQIPDNLANDALSILEMSFLAAPVLRGAAEFALPVPQESGYDVAWVSQAKNPGTGNAQWLVSEVGTPSTQAVWNYTPQQIAEGWLRFNPIVLEFTMLNASGQPAVKNGAANALTLTITNRRQVPITFKPGTMRPEGAARSGSIFYMHFGDLVSQADISGIVLASEQWQFAKFQDEFYGVYWAAMPASPLTLNNGSSVQISAANVIVTASGTQAQVYFDYYAVEGVNDGVSAELLAVLPAG